MGFVNCGLGRILRQKYKVDFNCARIYKKYFKKIFGVFYEVRWVLFYQLNIVMSIIFNLMRYDKSVIVFRDSYYLYRTALKYQDMNVITIRSGIT